MGRRARGACSAASAAAPAHAPSRVTAATPLRFDADASGPAAARAFAARWASARLVWMRRGGARDPSSPDDTARRVAAAVAAHAAGEFCVENAGERDAAPSPRPELAPEAVFAVVADARTPADVTRARASPRGSTPPPS